MTTLQETTLHIRQASTADVDLLCQTGSLTFREAFGAYNNPYDMEVYLAEAFSTARIASEIADEKIMYYLVEDQEQTAGYIKLSLHPLAERVKATEILPSPLLHLSRFYLRQEWHGSHAAHQMMQHCIDTARALHCKGIWLCVWQENKKAIRFYEKQGFRISGTSQFQLGQLLNHDFMMHLAV